MSKNKTLLVVGASSDVGQAYIREYSDRFDHIIGTYYNGKEISEALSKEIGDTYTGYRLDLTNIEEIETFGKQLCENGVIPNYVLFLSARKTNMVRLTEVSLQEVELDFFVEVESLLLLMRTFVPHMRDQRFGRICIMLSSVTKSPTGFNCSYMVSKHALLGLMRASAAELASDGITVNAVSPTMIDTKFISDASPLAVKKNISSSPLKRLAKVDEIIEPIAFLLDDKNSYMTGQNILISGGRRS